MSSGWLGLVSAPPSEGRGGAGALAVWADAGFSFGGLGPLKYLQDISRKLPLSRLVIRIAWKITFGLAFFSG